MLTDTASRPRHSESQLWLILFLPPVATERLI